MEAPNPFSRSLQLILPKYLLNILPLCLQETIHHPSITFASINLHTRELIEITSPPIRCVRLVV